jgi:FixJ family two-component response regulator
MNPANEPTRVITIAIVDDEPSLRVSLRRLCVALGMRATEYSSGSAFFDSLVEGTSPDCVLLDMHMPDMTGLDVQRQLLALGNRVPVIILTADDAPDVRARSIAAGAVAYLRKPIGVDELSAAIGVVTSHLQGTWLGTFEGLQIRGSWQERLSRRAEPPPTGAPDYRAVRDDHENSSSWD